MLNETVTLPSYKDRLEQFKKVKTRILSILLDYPDGLTTNQITLRYIQRFKHVARIDNRLRELRKDNEIESYPSEKGLLVWKLTSEWQGKPRQPMSPKTQSQHAESVNSTRICLPEGRQKP